MNICDFVWEQSSTPTITNINTSNMSNIIITGTGFDSIQIQNNQVMLGNVWPCSITQASSTQITCTPYPFTPVGTYTFSLNVASKGYANITSVNMTLTFPLVVKSLSPTMSGTGGGVLVSIEGEGFSQDTLVLIDNSLCSLVTFNYSFVTCLTPSNVNKKFLITFLKF